ncbi:MAG: helix-turn-helix transcriptional regulator [Rhodocyclaceae bacterium]|nr:helix-turn-helix transcriptional regulator [Rhodocyclaceae bacterium]
MSKKSDLTRERLLDAAGRVASREGYGAFTLEAVAAEAGTSKGGLLYHYASKELLIAGMVERMTHKFETARVEAMALDPAPWRLDTLLRARNVRRSRGGSRGGVLSHCCHRT